MTNPNGAAGLNVRTGDTLFAYVYLDPANVPREVMLQWNDGSWDHRAYWGANNVGWGTDGTSSRRYMGALPAAGGWVRPAARKAGFQPFLQPEVDVPADTLNLLYLKIIFRL